MQTHVEVTGQQQSEFYILSAMKKLWSPLIPDASLTLVKSCLAAGKPVILGASIDTVYQNADDDLDAPPGTGSPFVRNLSANAVGGHAMLAVGYVDADDLAAKLPNAPLDGYLIVKNSWGCPWADGGYG